MAVHMGNNNSGQTLAEAAGVKNNTNQNNTSGNSSVNNNTQYNGEGRRSIANFTSGLKTPMGRFSTSENVVAVKDGITEMMEKHFDNQAELKSFQIIAADKDKTDIGNVSCVIVVYERPNNGKMQYTFNTLLIEKTAPMLTSQSINIDGKNYEEIITTSDLYNNETVYRIVREIMRIKGITSAEELHEAGCQIVPSEVDTSDEELIYNLTFNSVVACVSTMDDIQNIKDQQFSIADIDFSQENLTIAMDYNPGKVVNFTNEPVRSDLTLSLQSRAKKTANDMFDKVTPISRIDGYVDLMYSPPAPAMQGQLPSWRHFIPRYVITRVDSEINTNTIPLQLLSLAQTNILASNASWAGVFKPRHSSKGIDTKDIGAIGYEVAMGSDKNKFKMVDTKANDFNFPEFLHTFFHEAPVISMDIEECGELSWLNDVFLSAANGDPGAKEKIVQAANSLTNNGFSNQNTPWDTNTPICTFDNRIHLGFYIDEAGERRDIRELDYLAIMNLAGKTDKGLVEVWEASYSQTNIPDVIRLEDRAKQIRNILSGVKFKSYANRINFSPAFLTRLLSACQYAGLIVQPQNVYQNVSGNMNRGYANAGDMALPNQLQANSPFAYSNNYNGNYSGHQPHVGRYDYARRNR